MWEVGWEVDSGLPGLQEVQTNTRRGRGCFSPYSEGGTAESSVGAQRGVNVLHLEKKKLQPLPK